MSNKHAKVLDASNMSIVTQKKVLIFQTLQSLLVDDCIDIVYQFSRQPVIMAIGHPKDEGHNQEIKAFDPSSNTWLDFTPLPVISEQQFYSAKRYDKGYHYLSITRISPQFDRLLISTEVPEKRVFYEFNMVTNECIMVDVPCYFKQDFSSIEKNRDYFNNHLDNLVLLEDNNVIANVREGDTRMCYPFIIGHTSKKTARCILEHSKFNQPKRIHSIPYWHCSVIHGHFLYVYTGFMMNNSIQAFDLLHCGKHLSIDFNIAEEHQDYPEIIIMNDILYIIGGGNACDYATSKCTRYDITVNDVGHDITTNKQLSRMANLNHARYGSKACVLEDKIFLFGGSDDNKSAVKQVECYDAKLDQWKVVSQLPEHWDGFVTGKTAILYL